MSASESSLAGILRDRALVDADRLLEVLQLVAERESNLQSELLDAGVFTRTELLAILENNYFCAGAKLEQTTYQPDLLKRIPERVARQHRVFPVAVEGEALCVAFADPDDRAALAAVAQLLGGEWTRRVALEPDLEEAIQEQYGRFSGENRQRDRRSVRRLRSETEQRGFQGKLWNEQLADAGAAGAVDLIVAEAVRVGATDIHFESRESELVVRMRIDGLLQPAAKLDQANGKTLISRLKVMAGMDIADRRMPQDGRASLRAAGIDLDLRLSSLPAQHGEKIVARILRKRMELLDLDRLEMPAAVRELHHEMLNSPLGIYLVTGPTGSGKTTTLYATLRALDRENLNVVTLEDPIEYSFDDLTQVQIHEAAGLTFEAGLKSILRQDPDVILLGEIRNLETVEVACRASLTGHKVFSTLHTNDATQAVTRLVEMGVPPYLVTSTLRMVFAQRLLRKICEECREAYAPSETERAILGYPDAEILYRGSGCEDCGGTGYRGRMALYEVFKLEENLHRLVIERAPAQVLRRAAERNGMISMAQFAVRAVLDGQTTVAEIQRVVLADEAKEVLCGGCQRVVNCEFSVCPFCEHVLHESCEGCGAAVEASWGACPSCGTGIQRDWQRIACESCFAPLDPSWGGCPYCGDAAEAKQAS